MSRFALQNLPYLSDLPEGGPEIRGGQPRYNIGDWVNVTCTSRNSLPAAELAWFINGEKADVALVTHFPETSNYGGLRTSRLGLTFKVRLQYPCVCLRKCGTSA